nr:integrase, catalytic region, zinc finger, CCHC-type, peptidase aspartic, catalytic [Tanacetum cinerariifolium]
MHNNSQGKKQEVEDQRRNVKLSKNKTSVTACNDSLNAKTLNVKYVSAMCDKCVLIDKHDMCVLNSVAKSIKRTVALESNKKPKNFTRKLYERVSKTCCWWYSKFTPSGYKWKPKSRKENVNPNVYYVEGLNHNLFSVGQFCDADLEVAFRKSTCYIRDLKGNDLLTDQISSDPAPERQTMALNHDSLSPPIQRQANAPQADRTVTTSNELDLLFSMMFDELLNGSSKIVSKPFAVSATDVPNQCQQHTNPLNNHTTPAPSCQVPTLAPTVISSENINQAETYAENDQVTDDEFINIFSTPIQDQGETSSCHVDSSNMHTFYQ